MKHLLTLALVLCLGTFASAQIPSYVPTNGLVGWWPFNGNANDESGNGNHGTVNGATLAADRFGNAGKAYSFDGVDDFLNISHTSSLAIVGDITISVWKKSFGNTGNYETFLTKRDGNGNWNYSLGASHYYGSGGCPQEVNKYLTGRRNGGGTQYELKFSDSLVSNSVNNWLHILLVIKNNTVSFYINDILTGSSCFGNIFNIPAIDLGAPLTIGSCNCGLSEYFNGLLDDIAIYNRALTPAEVQQLYLGNSSNTPAASTVPGKFHYQGVAVGANGKPIKNGTVGLRLSVLDSLPNGITLYTETQTASTDAAGIFYTYLGGGTATAGTFANILWANGKDKFLKVEMDAQGGTNYQPMGNTQLVSVPYAMAAGSLREGALLYGNNGQKYQITIDSSGPKWTLVPPAVAPFACGQAVTYAGEIYPTVQIGTQCWFQKNVNAGTMVLGANDQTNNGILEKYCYNNDTANCTIYGGLYQWAEAVQYQNGASNTTSPSPAFTGNVQGICPTGWHVPSDGEWRSLEITLGVHPLQEEP
jgi:hypothetical protein